MTRLDRRSLLLATALSCLAGYVDAQGYLSVGNFFVSFMSGNSTRLAIRLVQGQYAIAFTTAGIIALFVCGVILGSLTAYKTGDLRRTAVLIMVSGLLALAALAQTAGIPHLAPVAMVLAMGAENAVFQRDGGQVIGVTYMTGALVNLGERIAGMFYGGPRRTWIPYAALWLGLVIGACLGAAAHYRLDAAGLWLASAVALLLAGVAVKIGPK